MSMMERARSQKNVIAIVTRTFREVGCGACHVAKDKLRQRFVESSLAERVYDCVVLEQKVCPDPHI